MSTTSSELNPQAVLDVNKTAEQLLTDSDWQEADLIKGTEIREVVLPLIGEHIGKVATLRQIRETGEEAHYVALTVHHPRKPVFDALANRTIDGSGAYNFDLAEGILANAQLAQKQELEDAISDKKEGE